MTGYTWQVEKTENARFPFRISILEDGKSVPVLRTQDKWPGQRGNIFCVRESVPVDDTEPLEHVETVAITFLRRQGKRVEIILDRGNRKRCDFLFLKKKSKKGTIYEQIFFRTQTGIRSHRSKGSPYLYGTDALEIVIDSSERYPWNFPQANVSRDKLPVGDYALVWENRFAALVERKTFDNLLHDLYEIRILHQKLSELSSFANPAVVIEAQYGDFSDRNRIGDKLSVRHLSRLLGEIPAMHPGIQCIYAGNRKLANAWTVRFFTAVRNKLSDTDQSAIELANRPPTFVSTPVRLHLEIRKRLLEDFSLRTEGFRTREVKSEFSGAPEQLVTRIVQKLKKENRIYRVGNGIGGNSR